MNEPLTPDRVAALLPALDQVAATIAQRAALDPGDLRLLQLGLGLDEPWAEAELRRWADILSIARETGHPDTAVHALILRGVPQATAARAVSTATAAPSSPAMPTTTPPPAAPAVAPSPAPPTSRTNWPVWLALALLVPLLLLVGLVWWLSARPTPPSQTALAPTTAPTTAEVKSAPGQATGPAAYPSPSLASPSPAVPTPTPRNDALLPLTAPTQAATAGGATVPALASAATPTRLSVPTATLVLATPTPIPPTRTPRPRATLRPSAAACQPGVGATFGPVWGDLGLDAQTGCPTTPERAIVTAYQNFQRGYMIWRADNRQIYAVYDDGAWQVFPDTWAEGDDEYSCTDSRTPERTPPTPRRGIGKAWCTQPGVRDRLGSALGDENGNLRAVQDFERGTSFGIGERDPAVFILVNDSRRWYAG